MAELTASRAGEEIDAEQWFLAQLKPNAWRVADRNLRRQGFATFNPRERRTIVRRGRFVTEPSPLFPGYLFVKFDPATASWRVINSTYGVARLVMFEAHKPRVVPTALVESIMARCDGEGCLVPPDEVEPGTEVRITAGPFADFTATVESIAPDKRVWVMLEVMGRETRVLANAEAVKRA